MFRELSGKCLFLNLVIYIPELAAADAGDKNIACKKQNKIHTHNKTLPSPLPPLHQVVINTLEDVSHHERKKLAAYNLLQAFR